jgi:pimeloyl-ACP methyl ester carboxylesterase
MSVNYRYFLELSLGPGYVAFVSHLEATDRADTFVSHVYPEHLVDLGEVRLNYATAGDPSLPPLLLIPGQTESWWGYEAAMPLLAERFCCYAVDLRGQGRSTWTPGRYSLDNIGNDLVRFIDAVIGRPTLISGLSSGGVLAAWLSAYARPGQIIAAVWEDPPLFSSELSPLYGPGIRQCVGPLWALYAKWLGDQWSVGDWAGLLRAAPTELPGWAARLMFGRAPDGAAGPPQNLREYDPEWARAFSTGTVSVNCDHARMVAATRVPVLFTHHFRTIDAATGHLIGAIADEQAEQVRRLVTEAGQPFEYRSFPTQPHAMHQADPQLYASTVIDWAASGPAGRAAEAGRADR